MKIGMGRRFKTALIVAVVLLFGGALKYAFINKSLIVHAYALLDKADTLDDPQPFTHLAIVSTSCDKRFELWRPQFEMLFKYWPALKGRHATLPIYLVSNFKSYEDPRVQTIAVGTDVSWADNLIQALQKIDKDYVLLVMDDYILTHPVDEQRLGQVINLMRRNGAAYTEIVPDNPEIVHDARAHPSVSWLRYRAQMGAYRTSLQAAIWDRRVLQNLLKPGESAWTFELEANKRSFYTLRPFYVVAHEPLMRYMNAANAGATFDATKVVYDKKTVESLRKNGIALDLREFPVR